MNAAEQRTLDEIVFENRNKEYGSFRLRRQYFNRLAISFLISLTVLVMIVLGYSWYLNSAGDEAIYMYSSSSPYLKNTIGSLLSSEELNSYMNNPAPPKEPKNETKGQSTADEMHNFTIAENASDTFRPLNENNPSPDIHTDEGISNDSAVFGGYLLGSGEASGGGGQIDRFPIFPGGPLNKYIESVLKYPPQAIKQKIHGTVLLSFVVNKTGDVVNIKVERSINPILDAEAVKVVKNLPRWQPGLRRGQPVSIQLVIPVNFIPLN